MIATESRVFNEMQTLTSHPIRPESKREKERKEMVAAGGDGGDTEEAPPRGGLGIFDSRFIPCRSIGVGLDRTGLYRIRVYARDT